MRRLWRRTEENQINCPVNGPRLPRVGLKQAGRVYVNACTRLESYSPRYPSPPNALYCPFASGLSLAVSNAQHKMTHDDRPARRISSVPRRLTAMTEQECSICLLTR